jgi:hypothetical protein
VISVAAPLVRTDTLLHAAALIGKFNNWIASAPFWQMTILCEEYLRIATNCSFVALTSFYYREHNFQVLVAAFHSVPEATS